jgi:hypothetical protein
MTLPGGINIPLKADTCLILPVLLAMLLLFGTVSPGMAAGAELLPRKQGLYLVGDNELNNLEEFQTVWNTGVKMEQVVFLSSLNITNGTVHVIAHGKYVPRSMRLVKLKPSTCTLAVPSDPPFITRCWIDERQVSMTSVPLKGGRMTRLDPAEPLETGVYALYPGKRRALTFTVGDMVKYFADRQVDQAYYFRIPDVKQKRIDVLGNALSDKFTVKFMNFREGDYYPHPRDADIKLGVTGFKIVPGRGNAVAIFTLNAVKKIAMTDILSVSGGNITFPAMFDGCYFEPVSQGLSGNGTTKEYGFISYCLK